MSRPRACQREGERMLLVARELFTGVSVSTLSLRTWFNVSQATAKRDMRLIEQSLPVTATIDEFKRVWLRLERRKT